MLVSHTILRRVALSALPFLVASCSGGAAPNAPPAAVGGRGAAPAAVPVTITTVERRAMPIEIRVIGSAEAYSTVAVHGQVTGQLTAVNFKEGDDVTEGQPLFELDRRPLEAALQQAQANLDRDMAQAANAVSQAKRYQDLLDRGIATHEQVDTAQTSAVALNATVEADRAAVESNKVQLQYATITAPLTGRTGALMVHEGNLVRANDTVPLVIINQISPMYVSFGVPQARLAELKRYLSQNSLRVEASPPNEPGPAAAGRISFVDNAVDQTTGTIKIKGVFPNQDRRLWPGQFVNVVVTLTTDPSALVVPSATIQAGQQGSFVFVVKADKTVELRQVSVNRTSGLDSVVERGLTFGETVVTDGQLRLVPGSKIAVKNDDAQKVTP